MTTPRADTEAKVTLLAELFAAGLTYAQAAVVLGTTRRNVEYYAAQLRARQREEAMASAEIDWPVPAAPRLPVGHWTDEAVCFGHHALFHAPDGERITEREIREAMAKSLCKVCPVRNDCLAFAEDTEQKHGVWACKSEEDRAREERDRRNARRRVAARRAVA